MTPDDHHARNGQDIAAAEAHAALYDDDACDCKADLMNAFYAGAAHARALQRALDDLAGEASMDRLRTTLQRLARAR